MSLQNPRQSSAKKSSGCQAHEILSSRPHWLLLAPGISFLRALFDVGTLPFANTYGSCDAMRQTVGAHGGVPLVAAMWSVSCAYGLVLELVEGHRHASGGNVGAGGGACGRNREKDNIVTVVGRGGTQVGETEAAERESGRKG